MNALGGDPGNVVFTSLILRAALLDLGAAVSDHDVDLAVRRIEDEVIAQGRLSEFSAAAARCLVHGLWTFTGHALGRALETPAPTSSGNAAWDDPHSAGRASVGECLKEVSLGFPANCEILEVSKDTDCGVLPSISS
ncbi:hypothetical protein ACWGDX_01970 [Streptomyces sp. NPDC055025]